MLATDVIAPDLRTLTDAELAEVWTAGQIDLTTLEAECARRDAEAAREAARAARSARARSAARVRNADWEAAAYANYLAAEEHCNGFLLNDRGARSGRNPWPMLWQGSEERARELVTDDVLMFWDYVAPRPPGPREYAAVKRAERYDGERADLADGPIPEQAREREPVRPAAPPAMRPVTVRELAEQAATAPRPPGSIARYITALGHLQRQADRTARAMARVAAHNAGK